MKKFVSLFTALSIILGTLGAFTVFADETEAGLTEMSALKLGDYVQMGTYYEQPILWRCIAFEKIKGYESDGTPIIDSTDTVTEYRDGYLPLMLSDKIICCKAFDAKTNLNSTAGSNSETGSHSRRKRPTTTSSNYWADSNIRSWLNSTAGVREVEWLCGNPPHQDEWNNVLWGGYENEAGFLTNFSEYEKMAINTTSQKSIVAGSDKDLEGVTGSALHKYEFGMSKIVQNYDEAYSEQVKDTMFLLDIKQIDTVYKNSTILGEDYFIPYPTEEAATVARSYGVSTIAGVEQWTYMLRTPYCVDPNQNDDTIRDVCNMNGGFVGTSSPSFGSNGVRPAFFLDLSSVTFKSGDGTSDSPYAYPSAEDITEISTLSELEAFRDTVNMGNTYAGKTVTLTADIDMSEKYGEGKESWTPIGHTTGGVLEDLPTHPFAGTFDGAGHKITNLYINARGDLHGLFGVQTGTIQNLAVNGTIIASEFSGGVVGFNQGTVKCCRFSGELIGEFHVGGIAGVARGTITDCYNTATITASGAIVAGIVGLEGGTIERCYNTGMIKLSEGAEGSDTAAIACGNSMTVTDCYYLVGTADKGCIGNADDTTIALTSEQFADKNNFENWDFDTVWEMDESLGRPVLRSNRETPKHIHKICADEGCEDNHENIEWTAWDSSDTLPDTVGNYYLTGDVHLTTTWNAPDGINLCLNGNIIIKNNVDNSFPLAAIDITSNSLTAITDCADTEHRFSVGEEGEWVLDEENGTKTLKGGAVINVDGYWAIAADCPLDLYNINVTGSVGGVCCVNYPLNMYNCTIAGNWYYEAVYSDTALTMRDCEVFENRDGGVTVGGGTLSLGGKIIIADNTLYRPDGADKNKNLYLGKCAPLSIDLPLTENSRIGITAQKKPLTSRPTAITSGNETDYSEFFTSDNADDYVTYSILNDENNAIYLTAGTPTDFCIADDKAGTFIAAAPTAGTYTAILAVYSSPDNTLKSVTAVPVTFDGAEIKSILEDKYELEKSCKIKLMLWYDMESMKPCCKSDTVLTRL